MKKSLFLALATCAGLTVGVARAEDPVYTPPVFRVDANGLRLLDAVRLSLQNDPFIFLQDADTAGKAGVAREASGQFDTTLRGQGSYDYKEQELTDTVKHQQQQDRQDLTDTLPSVQSLSESLNAASKNLQNPALATDPGSVDLTEGVTDPATKIQMLSLETNLTLLTELINSAQNPSVVQNLTEIRNTILETATTQITRAANEAEKIRLDLEKAVNDLGAAPVDQWSRVAKFHIDLVKQFRNGIFVGPFADLSYQAANYKGKDSTAVEKGGLGQKDTYSGQVGFDVRVPLLRGLGRTSVAAGETAARKEYEASRFTLLHEKSRSVFATIGAYWDLRSAVEELNVAKRSEALEGQLLSDTQELIKAKERPRADEVRVAASHADSQARVAASERRLTDARVNLARVMGVALETAETAPLPSDGFPEPPDDLATTAGAIANLARAAVAQRMDYKAALLIQEAAGVLEKGARSDTKPRLDLQGRLFGTSTGESRISDLDRWVFKSASGTLELEAPFGNNVLRGILAQRTSSLDIAQIDSADNARTITLNVLRLSQALQLAADQVKLAEAAVTHYDQTIVDEQAKLKAGDSTLVDTILTEQQTTAARASLIAARRNYATTLAELRFEAGGLILATDTDSRVTDESLLAVPAPLRGTATPR